ncbi:MAG: tRNA pseudouridine(55) synthase TruB [Desulfuromonadales bacterium]|nr:tRNA pseudouridine(55) synthase TruB [Desulfuromonadales bacterium]
MNGFLVVDKPQGVTSFDVVRTIRRALKVRRVGHCGTLDPMATGVLPVAIGEATRLVEFVMDGEKIYRGTLKLGETTDTQDAEGTILCCRPIDGIGRTQIEAAISTLLGPIQQLPPMYSALKRDGVPLYELARKGVEVERALRSIEIYRFKLCAVDLPFVAFEVTCSKGTYVRTLAHDLGVRLGCGAHLTALRRLKSGAFTEGEAIPLDRLRCEPESVQLLPVSAALASLPALDLSTEALVRLKNGVPPQRSEVSDIQPFPVAGSLVTLCRDRQLVAVARFEPERENEARGDFVLLRVFPSNA